MCLQNWDFISSPHAPRVSNPLATEDPRLSRFCIELLACIVEIETYSRLQRKGVRISYEFHPNLWAKAELSLINPDRRSHKPRDSRWSVFPPQVSILSSPLEPRRGDAMRGFMWMTIRGSDAIYHLVCPLLLFWFFLS